MQFMPLLAISPRFFTPLFSRYHNALLEFDGAARVLIPYQHFTFIPLLMVAKFGEIPSWHPGQPVNNPAAVEQLLFLDVIIF